MLRILAFTLALASSAGAVTLTSSDIQDGGVIANTFRYKLSGQCNGGNVSPQLTWSGVPQGAQSLAVTIFDWGYNPPHGWSHWVLVDIPPDATGLTENQKSVGTPVPNDFKNIGNLPDDPRNAGYGGPCPSKPAPKDPTNPTHTYEITLWVLKDATPTNLTHLDALTIKTKLHAASAESSTITATAAYSDPVTATTESATAEKNDPQRH